MPGIITHLAIAKKIVEKLPEGTIKNEGLFYAGAIAPDGVHLREGYKREDKKKSHLREGITDTELKNKDKQELFHSRIDSFVDEAMRMDENIKNLYVGYVVHLLSDEMFVLNVRPDFVNKMGEIGILPTDIRFRDKIFFDMHSHDLMLTRYNEDMNNIFSEMKNTEIISSVAGYVEKREIEGSIDWAIKDYLHNKSEVEDPLYISYETILKYIDEAADTIIRKISDKLLILV